MVELSEKSAIKLNEPLTLENLTGHHRRSIYKANSLFSYEKHFGIPSLTKKYINSALVIHPVFMPSGYIVFAFPLVCSFVRLCVRQVRWIYDQRFSCKYLKWGISNEPYIRNHSFLDHRYPGGLAFIPWLLTPGSMPESGASGQNLGYL